jgi:mannitol-specific phosphotransferase system IIBC component
MVNVFASPGEVFEEVKRTPNTTTNWLVPAIIAALVGVVATLLIFSQPTVMRQIREAQERAMEQQVKAGKMTQQQADQFLAGMEKMMGPMMKIGGSVGAFVLAFGRVFWGGLVLWLISKWALKVQIPYLKEVEVAGLSTLIITLGAVVHTLLGVTLGKMIATAGPALVLKELDVTNKLHMLLAVAHVFNFWRAAIMGLGLARLTGSSWTKATLFYLIYDILFSLALIGMGMGQFAL